MALYRTIKGYEDERVAPYLPLLQSKTLTKGINRGLGAVGKVEFSQDIADVVTLPPKTETVAKRVLRVK